MTNQSQIGKLATTQKTKNQWAIIERKKYNIATMIDLGLDDPNYRTGVSLEGVYLMPRSKRVIVETYSIWENTRTHGCVGTDYHIADGFEIAQLAESFNNQRLYELIPEAMDC